MHVELLVVPGCPSTEAASALLRAALDDLGLTDREVDVVVIDTETAARERAFGGSPAFVVDGVDLFLTPGTPGSMACRLYPTPEGPRNVPPLADLLRALARRVGPAR